MQTQHYFYKRMRIVSRIVKLPISGRKLEADFREMLCPTFKHCAIRETKNVGNLVKQAVLKSS